MHSPSVFSEVIKGISRAKFHRLGERIGYKKTSRCFSEWNHLVAMIYGQLTAQGSLRQLALGFNAQYSEHYHLGVGGVKLSTLSYANQTRDPSLFKAVLSELIGAAGAHGTALEVVKIIDSSPIHLNPETYAGFAKSNGRCTGIKLHMELDANGGYPTWFDITPGNVNDITAVKHLPLTPGATYVFDRGYMKFGWWNDLVEQGCRIVSRMQKSVKYEVVETRVLAQDAPAILRDEIIRLSSGKSAKAFAKPLRLLEVQLDTSQKTIAPKTITIVSTDLASPAADIAALYKRRWQIELLFKWIKQKLRLKTFLGKSENAVKIQIITALITFLLLTLYKQKQAQPQSLSTLLVLIRANPFRKHNHQRIYDKHRQYQTSPKNQMVLI